MANYRAGVLVLLWTGFELRKIVKWKKCGHKGVIWKVFGSHHSPTLKDIFQTFWNLWGGDVEFFSNSSCKLFSNSF